MGNFVRRKSTYKVYLLKLHFSVSFVLYSLWFFTIKSHFSELSCHTDPQCFPDTRCLLHMSVKGCPTCPFPRGEWVSTTWKVQDTLVLRNDSQPLLVITTPGITCTTPKRLPLLLADKWKSSSRTGAECPNMVKWTADLLLCCNKKKLLYP